MVPLIKSGNVIKLVPVKAEHRAIKRVRGAAVLAVHAESRIEFGFFNGDVGQPAFLRLAADTDVQIMFQRLKSCVGEGDGFLSFRRPCLADL